MIVGQGIKLFSSMTYGAISRCYGVSQCIRSSEFIQRRRGTAAYFLVFEPNQFSGQVLIMKVGQFQLCLKLPGHRI